MNATPDTTRELKMGAFIIACGKVSAVANPLACSIIAVAGVVGGVALLLHNMADLREGADRCKQAWS
jgi:hypothetical protein